MSYWLRHLKLGCRSIKQWNDIWVIATYNRYIFDGFHGHVCIELSNNNFDIIYSCLIQAGIHSWSEGGKRRNVGPQCQYF